MEDVSWASVVVALALLIVIASVGIAAIWKYPADQALKIWGALGSLMGVVTGAFVTYFFTRQPIAIAERKAQTAEVRAVTAESKVKKLKSEAAGVASQVYSTASQHGVSAAVSLMNNPIISEFVEEYVPAATETLPRAESRLKNTGQVVSPGSDEGHK